MNAEKTQIILCPFLFTLLKAYFKDKKEQALLLKAKQLLI